METNVTLAPLLISNDAHECLKSWILICLTPDSWVDLFFWCLSILADKGSLSPNTNDFWFKPLFYKEQWFL